MKCPQCGEPSLVRQTFNQEHWIRRRRICRHRHQFSTHERIVVLKPGRLKGDRPADD